MSKPNLSERIQHVPPLIGIWWDDGTRLITFTELPDPLKAVHGICDSDFAHDSCWRKAIKQLKLSANVEYFDVARGRVMWHVKDSRSVILHGNGTSRGRLRLIASEFYLLNWTTAIDLHYLIGTDADREFDD